MRETDDPQFIAEVLGEQGCPWECSARGLTLGIIAATETFEERTREIRRAVRDQFMERSADAASSFVVVTGVLPHLIRQHHFFEGRQSPYRADSELLVQALGLARK